MASDQPRIFHAGDALQDLCRACKMVRDHTVIAADAAGTVLRVVCDYCGSQHNYRGGDREATARRTEPGRAPAVDDVAIVSERERSFPVTSLSTGDGGEMDIELILRRVIREETGLTPVAMADKWIGGELVLRPGKPDLQEKRLPVETFFHKVVMLRNRLRVLEQQINGADVPEELKIKLQAYITGCYGTLTSFNVLFAEEEDRFHGTAE
jgi:hypothetical protein